MSSPHDYDAPDDRRQRDILYFVTFCVEEFKHRHRLNGHQAFDQLTDAGIIDHLFRFYDTIHTMWPDDIAREIDELYENHQNSEQPT